MLNSNIGFTEFVEVEVDFDHVSFRDLEIELVSPSGATSRLVESFDTRANELGRIRLHGGFRFGSAGHLGEDPNGEWQLRVTDRIPGRARNSEIVEPQGLWTRSYARPSYRGLGCGRAGFAHGSLDGS